MSSTIQTPSAAVVRTSGHAEPHTACTYWNDRTDPALVPAPTTVLRRIVISLWFGIRTSWSEFRKLSLNNIVLWSLCFALVVTSCVLEQEPSHIWLQLALSLACFWLVSISVYTRKLMRTFRDRGREDSFIVTTAILSFTSIKAFAILDGYSIVALIRIPVCLTSAVWVASRWCNLDATPDIRFGA